jgi:hypothetical protein
MKGYFAQEQILPSRFLTTEGVTADYSVRVCDNADFPLFISDSYSRDAPIPSITADPQPLAEIGDPVAVIGPGGHPENETVLLQLGGTVSAGDLLMANVTNDGTGIVAVEDNWVGAVADEGGASGEIIRVTKVSPFILTAIGS